MFRVSSSPHIKEKVNTNDIMRDVVIAMVPTTLMGAYNNYRLFGTYYSVRSILLVLVAIISCVLAEFLFNKITKRESTIGDLSAVVTGMILALNLPVTFPFWMTVLGSFFAIIVVKQLFGGLGQNFMNPALGARCFLVLSFAKEMTAFFPDNVKGIDAAASATPLTALKNASDTSISYMDLFIGKHAGTIGETSIIALLIGVAYLLIKRVIELRVPLTYIAVFSVCILVFNNNFSPDFLVRHLMGGGLIFGAFYMATDYTTSPMTRAGRFIYGALLGILTAIIRTFGNTAEGVSFAIIFCNLLVPLIEKYTVPRAFGIKRGGRSNE